MSGKNRKQSDKILQVSPHIELKRIKEILIRLKPHKDVLIEKLSGSVKEDYQTIADNVSILYDTPMYNEFVKTIRNVFSDVHYYSPNTLGAYLNGCSVVSELNDKIGCSPICAGSIPNPSEENQSSVKSSWSWSSNSSMNSISDQFCDKTIMIANYISEKGKNRFTFVDMNENPHREKIYMYTEFKSLDSFPGFSTGEKKKLKEYGIERIHLIYYDSKNNKYNPLTEKYTKIDEFKSRETTENASKTSGTAASGAVGYKQKPAAVVNSNNNNSDTTSGSEFWIFLLFLIFLIVVLMIFIRNKNTY